MTSIARRREHNDSGEYSDASQENEKHTSEGDDAPPVESDYDSRGSDTDLSEKETDEQETERRVDDDEDRSNPQYIPKRGTFYEHDDRTAGEGESTNTTSSDATVEKKEPSSEAPPERRRPPRKSEIIDKWSHDKYNENEQVPKSRDELVSIYGYDIRNEDAPPHARRNRRYGRGPNKYTRTWEDEEAYRRQGGAPPAPRKPQAAPALSEFPELHTTKRNGPKRPPRQRSKSQPTSNDSLENDSNTNLRRNASIKSPKENQNNKPSPKQPMAKVNNVAKGPVKSGDVSKQNENLPPIENLNITTTVGNSGSMQRKVNASFGQQRPVPTVQGKKPAPPPPPTQQQAANNTGSAPPAQKVTAPAQQQQTGNSESRGSKRYSSLRQRPLADSYVATPPAPPAPAHRPYTENFTEYPAGNPPQQQPPPPAAMQQQIMHQVHRSTQQVAQSQHGPSPPHQNIPQAHAQQVRIGMMEQQMVSHPHPIHNMPPPPQPHALGGQMPPAQSYAPPAMLPAQFMQQGGSSVYPTAPMYAQPPPPPYPPHLFQHQYAGGVTYYSPAEQEAPAAPPPRAARRPTAAIPIVRPDLPDLPDRAPNSTEKDNIDRIVENMFVRKPWPSTNSADAKDKTPSETRASQEPTSKESSQPNSLTSSSISTESRPSAERTESKDDTKPEEESSKPECNDVTADEPDSIPVDA